MEINLTKIRFRFIPLLVFNILLVTNLVAQPQPEQQLPTPPEAASLGKFVEAPVNSFTGIPDISIPLCDAVNDHLSIPVSLSYHASGIRVDEVASWVGAGWSLNAGGVISRHINGLPDDDQNGGYLNVANEVSLIDVDFFIDILRGDKDSEPDMFTFSFPGYGGKFFFDNTGEPQIVPKQPLVIKYDSSSTIINWFEITTPEGVKYVFGQQDFEGESFDGTDRMGQNLGGAIVLNQEKSAWHLIYVESADGNYNIKLYYDKFDYQYKTPSRKEYLTGDLGITDYGAPPYNLVRVKESRLTKIVTPTKEILFNASTNREDLGIGSGVLRPKQLNEVLVKTGSGFETIEWKWVFNYGYFVDPNHSSDEEGKRLKLDSIQKVAVDNSAQTPPYTFDYIKKDNSYFLPYRLDKAIDYWGYYNGETTNNSPYNYLNIPDVTINGKNCPNCKGVRTTSPEDMKYGVLNKIVYPTGGVTYLDYEANRYKPTSGNLPQPSGGSEQIVTFGEVLKTCPGSIVYDECCGMKSDEDIMARSFTPDEVNNSVSLVMRVEKSIFVNDGCQNPVEATYTLIVLDPTTMTTVISPVTFNIHQELADAQNPNNPNPPAVIEKELSYTLLNIPGGPLQANTNYIFKIETKNVYGELKFLKKTYVPDTPEGEVYVGGLRVKQVRISKEESPSPLPDDIIKDYEYSDGTLFSRYLQTNSVLSDKVFYKECSNGHQTISFNGVLFFESPVMQFTDINGYHVGYEKVTEIHAGGNGKKVQTFNIEPIPAPPSPVEDFVGQPPATVLIDNGKLIKQEIFREQEINPITQSNKTIKINPYLESTGTIFRVNKVPLDLGAGNGNCNLSGTFQGVFTFQYSNRTKYFLIEESSESLDGVTTVTEYSYDPNLIHPFPKEIVVTNSDGKKFTTKNEYVFDFSDPVHLEMDDLNMISTPLRTIQEVDDNGNTSQIDGSEVVYSLINGFPRPTEFKRFERTWDDQGNLTNGSWENQWTILSYDNATGKPAQFQRDGWGGDNYTWDSTTGLIKSRTYEDFTWSYDYIPNSRLLFKVEDIDGQIINYAYDQLMRLSNITARDDGDQTDFFYEYKGINGATQNAIHKSHYRAQVTNSDLNIQETFQYFDGLGRPIQTVRKGYTPNNKDQAIITEYDQFGRPVKQYEPFETPYSDGRFVLTSQGATDYTETSYYSSPLNRVQSITPPGWPYPNTFSYGNNGSVITVNGKSYAANSLMTESVTDGNGNTTTSYKDKKGRLILESRPEGTNTYYNYDDKDRLTLVIPPTASVSTPDLLYKYTYDAADNMLTKQIPGMSGVMSYVYDDRNLPLFVQDPEMDNDGKWIQTTYDNYGRPTQTGFVNNNGTPTGPTTFDELLTETFYYGPSDLPRYQGKVKEQYVKILGTSNDWLKTFMDYDNYGRLIATYGNNHLNLSAYSTTDTSLCAEVEYFSYDFADNVLTHDWIHRAFGQSTYMTTLNLIDDEGRLNQTLFDAGNAPLSPKTIIADFEYSAKDEVSQKKLGLISPNNYVQELDYTYNPQGWLTHINQTMGATDVFQMELKYDNPDNLQGTQEPAYNGNISQIIWQTKNGTQSTYGFNYDGLDRLKNANYYEYINNAWSLPNGNSTYQTSYTYDPLGNIQSIDRNGHYFDGTNNQVGAIDDLDFNYYSNSNRLKSINESITGIARLEGFNPGGGTGDYNYDLNGNLTVYFGPSDPPISVLFDPPISEV